MEVEDWLDIHRRRREGVPIRQIAREKSLSRNTVRRALASETPPAARRRRRPGSGIDPYEPQIVELLQQDPGISTASIGRRIGWARSHTVLKDRVRRLRAQLGSERPTGEHPAEGQPLPADFTSFVGRRAELAHLRGLLGSARLISLTGPGGVGKTRLAIRAANDARDRFSDGACIVGLDALGDPGLVAQSLLDGLGIVDPSRSTGDPIPRLIEHLERRQTLLVLDNCEHLIDGVAPVVGVLLRRAPRLTVLLTSRQPLGIAGEHVVLVDPLELPPDHGAIDLGQALASPAVALFADRAAAALLGFAVTEDNHRLLAQVCHALEGIPLAIELASVRLHALSLAELLQQLDHRFAVLTEGSPASPPRQRTLQATIGWSFELCTEHERALWTRASVFAGGFDALAATAVCSDELLPPQRIVDAVAGLVTKSILVREEHAGRLRFRMLETIREFGQAQLPADERCGLRTGHRDWCLQLVGDCVSHWFGPDQVAWKQRMRREQANLRAALEFALDPFEGDSTAAQRLVGEPWFLWATAFSFTEHRRWLHLALDSSRDPTPERTRALATCGFVACAQGDHQTAEALAAESLALARALDLPAAIAYATHILGLVATFSGRTDAAQELLGDALERYDTLDTPDDLRGALQIHLGMLHLSRGELEQAAAHLNALHARCRARGESWERGYATDGLGFIALARGDLDGAASAAREGLQLAAAFDDTIGLARAVDLAAWTAAAQDQPDRAAILLGAASTLWGSFGQQLYGSLFWQEWREHWSAAARAALGGPAFEAAHRHGAGLSHGELLSLALDLGHRDIADPGSTSGLSSRERQIAQLVARGHTNREIAEQLFLSHRTIEGHISRALGKLDLHRRSQLAAWISHNPGPTA